MTITWRVPALMLAGIGAVLLRPQTSTVWWWALAVTVVTLADFVAAPSARQLLVTRSPSTAVRQNALGETVLQVRNEGSRRFTGRLRDAWQPSAGATGNRHPLDLRAGSSVSLTTPLTPNRRGERRTDRITVRSLGPLRLAAKQQQLRAPGAIRVLPAFPSQRLLPSRLARLRDLDGRASVRIRGAGTEFDSLREYVDGDDVRSIDWRASARTRDVVVRTWQPERDRRVVLALDTGRLSAGRVGDVPRLDAAMDAALLLAALASRAGDRIDFVAGDQVVRAQVKGRHGSDTPALIQNAMTRLEPMVTETSWERMVHAVDRLGRQRALVVLFTPLEPAAIDEGLLPLLQNLTRRHRVVLASVRDPELAVLARSRDDSVSTYSAAAAEQALAQRDHTAALLRTMGVTVIDRDLDDLPAAVSDHYLDLKAAGLL